MKYLRHYCANGAHRKFWPLAGLRAGSERSLTHVIHNFWFQTEHIICEWRVRPGMPTLRSRQPPLAAAAAQGTRARPRPPAPATTTQQAKAMARTARKPPPAPITPAAGAPRVTRRQTAALEAELDKVAAMGGPARARHAARLAQELRMTEKQIQDWFRSKTEKPKAKAAEKTDEAQLQEVAEETEAPKQVKSGKYKVKKESDIEDLLNDSDDDAQSPKPGPSLTEEGLEVVRKKEAEKGKIGVVRSDEGGEETEVVRVGERSAKKAPRRRSLVSRVAIKFLREKNSIVVPR